MPWTASDAEGHTKKADTPAKQKTWARIANKERQRCIDEGGDAKECDGRAIRVANEAVANIKEDGMLSTRGYFTSGTATVEVNALDIDGEKVPVSDLVTAYRERQNGDSDVDLGEAVWTTAYVNDLPDSSFAVIMPGGEKDEEGKTKPRSLRKLPYKDAEGSVDIPHLRNALARLPQMKGVSAELKAKALKTLQAAAKKHLKTHQEEADKELIEAVSGSLTDYANRVEDAFRSAFGRRGEGGIFDGPYPRDVFKGDPDLGDAVIIRDDGKMYSVGYEEGEDGFSFSDRGQWQEVVLTYKKVGTVKGEMAEAELRENVAFDAFMPEGDHSAAILDIVKEAGVTPGEGRRAPVVVDLQIIKPGPGNKKDNRYYPAKTLQSYAHVFENADIFVTDHKPGQRSEKTKVGRVRECPVRFSTDGAPVGRSVVYDPDMAEKIRNRADADELGTLHCSIYGKGDVRPGKVDGKEYGIVESISDGVLVEFVSRAGAGGHAENLAENDTGGMNMLDKEKIEQLLSESDLSQETRERLAGAEYEDEEAVKEAILREQAQEQEAPQVLAEAEVEKLVEATKLPAFAKAALKARSYESEAELTEAIEGAVKEVAKLTGSGQPFGQGGSAAAGDQTLSEREKTIRFNKRMQAVSGRQVPVPAE